MVNKRPTEAERKKYVAFLEKRLASANYKKNVSKEEYTETQAKLKREKFILGIYD